MPILSVFVPLGEFIILIVKADHDGAGLDNGQNIFALSEIEAVCGSIGNSRVYDVVAQPAQLHYGVYSAGAVVDPRGADTGGSRVLRGGSWGSRAMYCRSAYRGRGRPGSRFNNYGDGFRLALSPE